MFLLVQCCTYRTKYSTVLTLAVSPYGTVVCVPGAGPGHGNGDGEGEQQGRKLSVPNFQFSSFALLLPSFAVAAHHHPKETLPT